MKRLIALAFILLVAAGCAEPNVLVEGEVVDKSHTPQWDEWIPGWTQQVCSGVSPNQICVPIHHPGHWRHHPDDYDIWVEGSHGERIKTEKHDVTFGVYENCHIGDWWTKESACNALR